MHDGRWMKGQQQKKKQKKKQQKKKQYGCIYPCPIYFLLKAGTRYKIYKIE